MKERLNKLLWFIILDILLVPPQLFLKKETMQEKQPTEIEKEMAVLKSGIKSLLRNFRINTGLKGVSVSSQVTLGENIHFEGCKVVMRDDITIHINE